MIATTAFVLVEANSALSAPVGAISGRPALVFSNIFQRPAASRCARLSMDIIQNSIAAGKYLVSPLIKDLDDGRFAASVSIRSGRGSGMHDRVMRFTPRFACRAAAVRYAIDEGLGWVRERTAPRARCAA
jgi:hypothetical protein